MAKDQVDLSVKDIFSLILWFLVKHDMNKTAKRLLKESHEDLLEPENQLQRKKLANIVHYYVQQNPDCLEKISKKHKKIKKGKKESKNQQDNHKEEKEGKKNKKESKKKDKKDIKKEQKEELQKQLKIKSEADTKIDKDKLIKVEDIGGRFSRCSGIKFVNAELFENNYEKRALKGHIDEFGQVGWQRLGSVQGKEFKKQKNKLKNFETQGSKISMQNNLIDL